MLQSKTNDYYRCNLAPRSFLAHDSWSFLRCFQIIRHVLSDPILQKNTSYPNREKHKQISCKQCQKRIAQVLSFFHCKPYFTVIEIKARCYFHALIGLFFVAVNCCDEFENINTQKQQRLLFGISRIFCTPRRSQSKQHWENLHFSPLHSIEPNSAFLSNSL